MVLTISDYTIYKTQHLKKKRGHHLWTINGKRYALKINVMDYHTCTCIIIHVHVPDRELITKCLRVKKYLPDGHSHGNSNLIYITVY